MGRTLAVTIPPAALIALLWLRLEERPVGSDWLWCALLALVPALAPLLWLRLALIAPAALVAAWVALDTPSTDDRRGFFEAVYLRFDDGFFDFYDVQVPFSGVEQPHMHGVLALAIFAFCLVLGQLVAARKPLPAVLTVIAGAGWPATLYPVESVTVGAVILAAALYVLAGLRTARPGPALVAGAVLVLAAAGASTSAAVAKDGVLAWERWDPSGSVREQVSVGYVWDANYGGIEFPRQKTVVLRIRGPERGLYWRATTLDQFTGDRWIENLPSLSEGVAVGPLADDPLLPRAAYIPGNWTKQEVEVVALAGRHLVAATQARSLEAAKLGRVEFLGGGVVRAAPLARGQRYVVYSYAPRPQPKQLARLGAAYPPELDPFLDLGRTRVEPFGRPGRDARVDALFRDDRYLALWPYRPVWEEARRLRAGARTPYGAVVAIETWLRSTGGFVYDQSPPPSGALPPLAAFVQDGRAGYCQQFAGAMALMLRFLGIPARVAAGFTSGKREDGGWTVTDHNAHAWVEVWFPQYGWLAFDPTPGRGALAATYSASSTGFNAGDAADAFGPQRGTSSGGANELRLFLEKERLAERQQATGNAGDSGGPRTLWLLLGLVVAAGGAVGAAKLVRRRLRYLTRDPRRLAAAARHELADFLVDQGLAVGPSATPAELHQLVRHELGVDARPFAAALAEARFGPPRGSAAAARSTRRELRALLRTIRRTLGRRARLQGLVRLRSLRT